jgi:hypothetical protein
MSNKPIVNVPEYIRLPAPGTRCVHTGLSRSSLNNLILPCKLNGYRPPVHSVCLKRPGTARGTRLVGFSSLMEYIESMKVMNDSGQDSGAVR